jgi:hypothetical protein
MINKFVLPKLPIFTHTASCVLSVYPKYYEYQINIIDGVKKIDTMKISHEIRNGYLFVRFDSPELSNKSKNPIIDIEQSNGWNTL